MYMSMLMYLVLVHDNVLFALNAQALNTLLDSDWLSMFLSFNWDFFFFNCCEGDFYSIVYRCHSSNL